jgi:hypothetical protein
MSRSRRPMATRGMLVVLVAGALLLSACGNVPNPISGSPTPQAPRQLTVVAVDSASGDPVPGAAISAEGASAVTAADGRATINALRGASVAARADGYDPASGAVPATGDLTLRLRPNVVHGTVTDPSGAPVAGVRIFVDGSTSWVRTDEQGRYALPDVPTSGTLVYKRAGYRLGELAIDGDMTRNVVMQPFQVRALYAPASVFEGAGRLDQMLATIDSTEVNAMVIDVKEAGGYLYYASDLPEVKAAGAVMAHPLLDLKTLLPRLHAKGIYAIARVVTMKDDTLPKTRPELAVHNSKTGKPWTDYAGNTWLNPYAPGVAEYYAGIAGELAAAGFDEVQFDYVRFFSDGDYATADTGLPNTQSLRLPAMRRFFRIVSDRLSTTHAFLGADVFPISFIAEDDQGIGQRPEVIMPYVDYFDPMVYPSHYASYTFGYASPNDHPYEIINDTLKIMNREAAGLPMEIRPWIQDFGFGSFRAYTATDIKAEMRALRDNNADGWMIWNAAARFTTAALGPPRPDEAAGAMTSTAPMPTPTFSPAATPSTSASVSPGPTATP